MANGDLNPQNLMIELRSDNLTASFTEVHPEASLTLDFQRTLRIPDDGRDYPLPPGLGSFPLRHIDDFAGGVPESWLERGGVLLPMWQSEALWLNFRGKYLRDRETEYPFAIKVATGKLSAITGQAWQPGLSRNPQDYLVFPSQPWLDGYYVERGIIRQFVAMPLGEGFSVEEQLTGRCEAGGLQVEVFPMRREIFEKRFPVVRRRSMALCCLLEQSEAGGMGLAPGGRMRQEIYEDPFSIHDWDTEHGSRCFIHLVNSATWRQVTGEAPPTKPLTAQQYSAAGYPWFDYYDAEQKALEGGQVLGGVKSIQEMREAKRRGALPDNEPVSIAKVVKLRPGLRRGQVRETDF